MSITNMMSITSENTTLEKKLQDWRQHQQLKRKIKLAQTPEFPCHVIFANAMRIAANLKIVNNPIRNEKFIHIMGRQQWADLGISVKIPLTSIRGHYRYPEFIVLTFREDPEPLAIQFPDRDKSDAVFKAIIYSFLNK